MTYPISESDPASATPPKGAATVGKLTELDEAMQVFVLYMRRWTSGAENRDGVWTDAVERFGTVGAWKVIAALDFYLLAVSTHAVRPIQCHGKTCNCLGEDEATLMEIVRNAGCQNGPLLRMLGCRLLTPTGFTETIAAAAQLFEMLCEPGFGRSSGGASARRSNTLH